MFDAVTPPESTAALQTPSNARLAVSLCTWVPPGCHLQDPTHLERPSGGALVWALVWTLPSCLSVLWPSVPAPSRGREVWAEGCQVGLQCPPARGPPDTPLVGALGPQAVGVQRRLLAAAGPVEEEGSPRPRGSLCLHCVFFLVPIVQLSEVCSADSALARPPRSWRAGWLPCGGPGKGCS